MDAPTLGALQTVAGATILVAALMQILLGALRLAPATQDRFGPLLAVVVGVVVVEVATFTLLSGPSRADVVQGAVNGIFAGLAAIGVHSVVTNISATGQ
jgi:hypothetical protein